MCQEQEVVFCSRCGVGTEHYFSLRTKREDLFLCNDCCMAFMHNCFCSRRFNEEDLRRYMKEGIMYPRQSSLEMVHEFAKKFGHPVVDKPDLSNFDLCSFRHSLIREETDELWSALEDEDIPETLDALCDLQYVLDGAFLALGFWKIKDKAMVAVHESNMSKLGADGKPIYREDGKILKGPNFKEPDLQPLIEELNS